jgi:CheY-like chemotaxis protein
VEILEPRSARGAVAPDFSTKKPVISGLFFGTKFLPIIFDPFFTVLLELPRIRRVATASTTKETEAPMVAKTVLVVEDDPCVRIVAEEMFAAAGIEVETVQRADHALAIVAQRSEQTALLFTDVQTPGPIDGIDLARLVKTHWPHVEVLVTSGRPVSNIVLPGGVRFTSKPWSRKEVLELARAAVAKQ